MQIAWIALFCEIFSVYFIVFVSNILPHIMWVTCLLSIHEKFVSTYNTWVSVSSLSPELHWIHCHLAKTAFFMWLKWDWFSALFLEKGPFWSNWLYRMCKLQEQSNIFQWYPANSSHVKSLKGPNEEMCPIQSTFWFFTTLDVIQCCPCCYFFQNRHVAKQPAVEICLSVHLPLFPLEL